MGKITGFLELARIQEVAEAPTQRVHHYREFVAALTDDLASKQGARCMDCGIPFCNNGCPVNNIIPDFNDLVYRGDWKNAFAVLDSTNNFPEFTGRICPAPCEAACVLNINDDPVGIKSIERTIIDRATAALPGKGKIGLIGRKILEHGRFGGRAKNVGVILIAALVALAIGYIGLFCGRMIKAGVSRTRERLADASAVQFTRQTQGLAGALKKIGGLEDGSRLNQRADAEEVSHMLFGDGIGFSGLFATHPPLLERIRELEPSFAGEQLERLRKGWQAAPPNGMQEDIAMGLDGGSGSRLPAAGQELAVTPPMVAAQVAMPAADDYKRADSIVGAIPDALRDLASQRDTVMPLLLGMLLADDETVLALQHVEISTRLGQDTAAQAIRIHQQLTADLHPMLRLPLAALAFPVLRMRPRPQLETFLDTVHAAVHADGDVSLFEYCLGRLLTVQVRESLDPARYARFGRRKPGNVRNEFATLLSVVAQAGHNDEASAKRAYLAGLQRVLPRDHLPYAPPANGVLALDEVWAPLDALDPLAKQAMVEAVTAAVSHDGRVSVAEAELLRTICGVLHCPLPPMLERG